MPPTRYQGSKRRLLGWIWENIKDIPFHTVLDAFSGSACVSHWLKRQGKAVTCNDVLASNALTARALIENPGVRFTLEQIEAVLQPRANRTYDDFIQRTFQDIYFLDEENRLLDVACQNIPELANSYQRAIAYYALFQAAVAKRPYNLFHRKNLYMRTADVKRSFGNKTTWDRSFEAHVRDYVTAANRAVFDAGVPCHAVCGDALDVQGRFDLVYIDPPYINSRGVGVDYYGFYHFLEGMADYAAWPAKIDQGSKHRRLIPVENPWTNRRTVAEAFGRLFRRFADSVLVVSYRSDGIPSVEELVALLGAVKSHVTRLEYGKYTYALSTNSTSKEVLLIGAG